MQRTCVTIVTIRKVNQKWHRTAVTLIDLITQVVCARVAISLSIIRKGRQKTKEKEKVKVMSQIRDNRLYE